MAFKISMPFGLFTFIIVILWPFLIEMLSDLFRFRLFSLFGWKMLSIKTFVTNGKKYFFVQTVSDGIKGMLCIATLLDREKKSNATLLAREKKASAHVLARWEAPSFYDTFRSVRS